MRIEWNKVTWYSKLLAVILFVVVFKVAFVLGMKYEKLKFSNIPHDVKTYSLPAKFTLSVGQSAELTDMVVTFSSVEADSRCPVDVQCIWAGALSAKISLKKSGKTESKIVSSENPLEYSGYSISIEDISPAPNSKKKIEQSDYKLTFKVAK